MKCLGCNEEMKSINFLKDYYYNGIECRAEMVKCPHCKSVTEIICNARTLEVCKVTWIRAENATGLIRRFNLLGNNLKK